MDQKNMIEAYFLSWIQKNRSRFQEIFAENVVYSECYGPEYHGLPQIMKWFDDWNKNGSVLTWDIKNLWHDNALYVVEWYFKCDCAGNVDGFDGVSLIAFNEAGKIVSVKEFESKAEHCFPYQ